MNFIDSPLDAESYLPIRTHQLRAILKACPKLCTLSLNSSGHRLLHTGNVQFFPTEATFSALKAITLVLPARLDHYAVPFLRLHSKTIEYLALDYHADQTHFDHSANLEMPALRQFRCNPPTLHLLQNTPVLAMIASEAVCVQEIKLHECIHSITSDLGRLDLSNLSKLHFMFRQTGPRDVDLNLISSITAHCPRLRMLDLSSVFNVSPGWPNTWTKPSHRESDIAEVCRIVAKTLPELGAFGYHHSHDQNLRKAAMITPDFVDIERAWVMNINAGCPRLRALTFGKWPYLLRN